MIAFDLACSRGHQFEGWFKDGKAYEEQYKRGLISCPVCNDTSVSKVLSTFAIKKPVQLPEKINDDTDALAQTAKKIAEYVEKNFDNVGAEFSKEALKIHYGVSEPRNIRGVSTKEEEKILKKEGIQFFKIPLPTTPDRDS